MVEENLSVLQEAADTARSTYEKKTSPYQPEADPVSVSTPAQKVQPTPIVTPAPVLPVAPVGPKPYEASDPSLVFYELNENPVMQDLNRIIYGDEMIDIVMDARANGNLDQIRDRITPTPAMQMMMSESGQPAQTIGLYLMRANDPVSLENLRGRIGEAKFDAVGRSVALYSGNTDIEEPKPRGWLGASASFIGSEVSGLSVGAELPIGLAAGLTGFVKNTIETVDGLGAVTRFGPTALPRRLAEFAGLKDPGRQSETNALDVAADFVGDIEQSLINELDTFTGNFIAGATEFLTGLTLAPAKIIKGSSVAAQISNAAVKGALVDGVIFDDEDGNLTSLLKEAGLLESNLVVDFLSADEDDSKLEKFTASLIEGAALSVGIDALIAGTVKGIRALNKGNIKEGVELLDQAQADMFTQVQQDHLKFLADLRTDAEKIAAGEYVPDFKLLDPDAPYRPDFQLVDEAPAEAPAAKATTDAKPAKKADDTPAGKYQMPRPEAPDSTVRDGEPFIEFNNIPGFDEIDATLIEDLLKYVKFQRRANDLDASLLSRMAGVDDLAADLLYKDANQMREMIKDRVKAVFGKIQQPKDRFKVIAMAAKVLDHHGASFLAKDLRKSLQTDVSKWSDEAAANLVASSVLQDMLQEQYMSLVSDIASYRKGVFPTNIASRYQKMFPNYEVKDVDDLRMLKQLAAAKMGQLRVGNAKVASNAGRALRMVGLMKRADTKLARDQMKAQWQREQGMIDDKGQIERLDIALQEAMKTKKGAAAVNDVIKANESMGFLEAYLRVTNAGLLLGLRTQILMAGSNAIRVLTEGVIKISTGSMDVARAIRYWGTPDIRKEALQSASRNTRQGLLWYATMPSNSMRFFKGYMRYWKKGLSDFDQRVTYDEEQTFTGMTLREVFKQDPTKVIGAAEILYRFMGSVDEAFKEITVMTDQQVRMATGEFGSKNSKKAAWDITPDDINQMLAKNPDAVASPVDGRLSDITSVERAKEAMFLWDPVEGSARSLVVNALQKRKKAAFLFRILSFRFLNVPLAVMEGRVMNIAAPVVLAQDTVGSMLGKGGGAKHWRVAMGKYADDLGAEGKENVSRRQRARGILALNTTLAGAAYIAVMNGGVDWINTDPTSPDYMKVRVSSADGTERWSNALDFESPLSAFIIHYVVASEIAKGLDPESSITVGDSAFQVTAVLLNESIFKSSLKNMTENLALVSDVNAYSFGSFIVQNIAPMNLGGWWQRKTLNLINNNPLREENKGFDGSPIGFMEQLAKQVPPFRLVTNGLRNSRRNALGELIKPTSGVNPFLDPIQLDDPIIRELELIQAQTGTDFIEKRKVWQNVKMEEFRWSASQSVWDRAQHLIAEGEVKVGGVTLRQELEFRINSKEYKAGYLATRDYLLQNPKGPDGQKTASYTGMQDQRVQMISEALNIWRRAAVEMAIRTMAPEDKKRLEELMNADEVSADNLIEAYSSID